MEEVKYLSSKGVFEIPPPSLLKELISSYIEWVHVVLPILDIDTVTSVLLPTSNTQTSLLLFQAIVYASSTFVDEEKLRLSGFTERRAAQDLFFKRVKLLLDFNYECDRLCLLQTTILMSLRQDDKVSLKDCRHYLTLGYSIAQLMGFCYESTYAKHPPETSTLLRGVWWCLYSRDKLLAIATMQPPLIKEADFNVDPSTLLVDDLANIGVPSQYPRLLHSLGDYGPKFEVHEQQPALLFLEQTRLCLQIGSILNDLYRPVAAFSDSYRPRASLTTCPVPKETAKAHQRSLEKWWQGSQTQFQLSPLNTDSQFRVTGYQQRQIFQHGILAIFYFATSITLHQWLALSSIPTSPSVEEKSRHCSSLELDSHMILYVWKIVSSIDLGKVVELGGHLCVIRAIGCLTQTMQTQQYLGLGASASRIQDIKMCLQSLRASQHLCHRRGSDSRSYWHRSKDAIRDNQAVSIDSETAMIELHRDEKALSPDTSTGFSLASGFSRNPQSGGSFYVLEDEDFLAQTVSDEHIQLAGEEPVNPMRWDGIWGADINVEN
ncbi:uncharacterized protein A1O5_06217 [Cladophialophora psammophila CBS 110553]|uniref:Xylanolytic transcriptional activator regulatory domain-containing protein n=1 Tax=Cladophialophora psammophila CBS 110553 TaxID=1182543 RepID=W9XIG1_9EURO|nr:uncharacterized protein A1O5_06217 [Cladophialophora psammophila CBS 110553]EXJ70149.1 hypothetical protein A1O5_06217 [Cladophialophora psammophila CBS 110553]